MLAVMGNCKGMQDVFQYGENVLFGEYEGTPLKWHVVNVNNSKKMVLIIADSYCGVFTGGFYSDNELLDAMDEFAKQAFTDAELKFICKTKEHYAFIGFLGDICKDMSDRIFLPDKDKNKGVRWWYMYGRGTVGYVDTDGSTDYSNEEELCHMRPVMWVKYDYSPANNNENTDKNKKKQ